MRAGNRQKLNRGWRSEKDERHRNASVISSSVPANGQLTIATAAVAMAHDSSCQRYWWSATMRRQRRRLTRSSTKLVIRLSSLAARIQLARSALSKVSDAHQTWKMGSQPKCPSAAGTMGTKKPMKREMAMYQRSRPVCQHCRLGGAEHTHANGVETEDDGHKKINRDTGAQVVDAAGQLVFSSLDCAQYSHAQRPDHEVDANRTCGIRLGAKHHLRLVSRRCDCDCTGANCATAPAFSLASVAQTQTH